MQSSDIHSQDALRLDNILSQGINSSAQAAYGTGCTQGHCGAKGLAACTVDIAILCKAPGANIHEAVAVVGLACGNKDKASSQVKCRQEHGAELALEHRSKQHAVKEVLVVEEETSMSKMFESTAIDWQWL